MYFNSVINELNEGEAEETGLRVCGYEYLRAPCGGWWQDMMKHE